MQSENTANKIDEQKLHEFMIKAVGDIASTMSAMLVIIGDRLGLYKAMAEFGYPITSEELAQKTSTNERYIREWLANQAAGGYITYNAANEKYTLPSEQAMALADENSPVYVHGAYQSIKSFFKDEEKFIEVFKTNYVGNLVSSWIHSLDGIEEKLKQGAKVADIGCGYGISTILMAKEYPNSKFYGFDNHNPSIEQAKEQSRKEGITSNLEFSSVSASDESIGNDYDLITFFDCLHDMGDPIGAMKFAKQSLKPDGTCMIIEPMANDKVEDNLNLVGRIYYAASTVVCVPNSLADNGPALGAQAGEKRIKEIVEAVGFTKFRRATQTPFNIIYEVKP